MSKKTHRLAEEKEKERARRVTTGAGPKPPAPPKASAPAKTTGGKPAGGRPSGGARVFDRPASSAPAAANVMTVRIAGIVVALAAALGGFFWAQSANGNFTTPMLLGLIVLGVVAGLGLFSAVRAKEVAARMKAQRRR